MPDDNEALLTPATPKLHFFNKIGVTSGAKPATPLKRHRIPKP